MSYKDDKEDIFSAIDLIAGYMDHLNDLIENTVGEEYIIKDEIKILRSFTKDVADLV